MHAGVGNISRAEAALFAIMFGKNLAEPASPFEQNNDAAKRAAGSSSSRSSRHNVSSDDGFAYLGRKCLWLGKDYAVSIASSLQHYLRQSAVASSTLLDTVCCSCGAPACLNAELSYVDTSGEQTALQRAYVSEAAQDPHPLDGAVELGAHCQGPALAAFIKQYFSVIQYDFMKRGYLCHAGLRHLPADAACSRCGHLLRALSVDVYVS